MAVNCSATRFHVSWIAVELPMNVVDILRPFGGMSQIDDLTLFGIHSTKYDEFLFTTLSICSSTSFVDMRPRKRHEHVRYRPWRGSAAHIMFFASNCCCVSSGTVSARYCCEPREADHEEVEARERDHVDRELAQVAVELAREAEAASRAANGRRDKVVEVTVRRRRELERAEADVVQRLVVERE